MDLLKIGKFIKEQRKSKKLTQLQLAEKLLVSEKTISKWECGNGFPDATLILPLCKELDINANELLSGEKLSEEKAYKKSAEDNIINLRKEQEKTTKFLLTLEWFLGIFSIIILYGSIMFSSLVQIPDFLRVLLIIVGFLICMIGFHLCIVIEKDAGFYECKHCHHKYVPTLKQTYFSMHIGRTRFIKCPKCNKKSWQNKTINKD